MCLVLLKLPKPFSCCQSKQMIFFLQMSVFSFFRLKRAIWQDCWTSKLWLIILWYNFFFLPEWWCRCLFQSRYGTWPSEWSILMFIAFDLPLGSRGKDDPHKYGLGVGRGHQSSKWDCGVHYLVDGYLRRRGSLSNKGVERLGCSSRCPR